MGGGDTLPGSDGVKRRRPACGQSLSNRYDSLRVETGLPGEKTSRGGAGAVTGATSLPQELGWRKGLRGVSRSLTKTPFGALPRIPGAFPHCRDGQLSQREWGGPGDPAVTGSAPRLHPARLPPTAAPRPYPPRTLTARPGTASRPGAARRMPPSRPPAPRPPPRGPASPRSSPRATLRAEAWSPDS